MTQDTAPAPSWIAAWTWENRKAHATWFYLIVTAIGVLGAALGATQYLTYRAEFEAQHATWAVLWGQGTLLPTMLFFPLVLGVVITQITSNEHEGRAWSHMIARGLDDALFLGKLAYFAQLAVTTSLVMVVELGLTGLVLGFDPAGFGIYVLRLVPLTLGLGAIGTFALLVGIQIESFAGAMAAFLGAVLAGLALTVVAPVAASWYPLSLMTAAAGSRDPGSVGAMGPLVAAAAIGAGWTAILALLARRAMRRLAV